MTTNSDILSFLQASKEDHAREKEEDRVARSKERKEDMEYILAEIQKRVQNEIMTTIKPLEVRLKAQEKVNSELTLQFNTLLKEMEVIKQKLHSKQLEKEFPRLTPGPLEGGGQEMHNVWQGSSRGIYSTTEPNEYQGLVGDSTARQDMCSSARKVVGFTPIKPRMLQLQMQSYGAKDLEEAKVMEIKSYLMCEMKMRPSDIEKLGMVKVFPPARDNWNVLYVEFASDYQVDMVMSHTRFMVKKDHRVVRWYPRQMFERYKAVESIAYDIRKNKKHRTRVKVGRDDIELSVKETGSSVWKRQALPNSLPGFEITAWRPATTSSPPPGRPGRGSGSLGGNSELARSLQTDFENTVAEEIATANN